MLKKYRIKNYKCCKSVCKKSFYEPRKLEWKIFKFKYVNKICKFHFQKGDPCKD